MNVRFENEYIEIILNRLLSFINDLIKWSEEKEGIYIHNKYNFIFM